MQFFNCLYDISPPPFLTPLIVLNVYAWRLSKLMSVGTQTLSPSQRLEREQIVSRLDFLARNSRRSVIIHALPQIAIGWYTSSTPYSYSYTYLDSYHQDPLYFQYNSYRFSDMI
jgi:hypothetical protein